MTRDEAIKVYTYAVSGSGQHFLDGLVALGILKLDEPKDDGFHKLVTAMGYHPQGSVAADIKKALASASLKIVEKGDAE